MTPPPSCLPLLAEKQISNPAWLNLNFFTLPRLLVQSVATGLFAFGSLRRWSYGVAGALGLTAIVSVSAVAYTSQALVTVQRTPGEGYEAFIRRAEIAVRAAAQRSFDSDILVTDVDITVMGDSGGLVVPMLVLRVNRNQWRSHPDPQRWAFYYRSARPLLDLDNPNIVTEDPPGPTVITPAAMPPTAPSPEQLPGRSGNPVQINLPAAPSGQLGLPRSILRQTP